MCCRCGRVTPHRDAHGLPWCGGTTAEGTHLLPPATTTPNQPAECGHWDRSENRYCLAGEGVRLYRSGHRCPQHTPARLAGRPESSNTRSAP
jgi:hypothetical protein